MTEKQTNYIHALCKSKGYVLIAKPEVVSNINASKIISFLAKNEGQYVDVFDYIRKKGPAIKELNGDFLYDDSPKGRAA